RQPTERRRRGCLSDCECEARIPRSEALRCSGGLAPNIQSPAGRRSKPRPRIRSQPPPARSNSAPRKQSHLNNWRRFFELHSWPPAPPEALERLPTQSTLFFSLLLPPLKYTQSPLEPCDGEPLAAKETRERESSWPSRSLN